MEKVNEKNNKNYSLYTLGKIKITCSPDLGKKMKQNIVERYLNY